MSASSGVMTIPQSRPIDRKPAWILFAAAVLASASAITVAALVRGNSQPVARSKGVEAVQSVPAITGTGPDLAVVGAQAQDSLPAITGTGPDLAAVGQAAGGGSIASTRPLSDAAFVISTQAPIQSMRVFDDEKYLLQDTRILSMRPLSDGGLGSAAATQAAGNNPNAGVGNCYQCR